MYMSGMRAGELNPITLQPFTSQLAAPTRMLRSLPLNHSASGGLQGNSGRAKAKAVGGYPAGSWQQLSFCGGCALHSHALRLTQHSRQAVHAAGAAAHARPSRKRHAGVAGSTFNQSSLPWSCC